MRGSFGFTLMGLVAKGVATTPAAPQASSAGRGPGPVAAPQ
jgi:hypothetical protein